MKIKPRPIIKITNIAEIVPDKYPESAFPESALKLFENHWTVVQICAQTMVWRGCKQVQEGNAQNLEAPRIPLDLSIGPSGDYIWDAQRSNPQLCDQSEWPKPLHCTAPELWG